MWKTRGSKCALLWVRELSLPWTHNTLQYSNSQSTAAQAKQTPHFAEVNNKLHYYHGESSLINQILCLFYLKSMLCLLVFWNLPGDHEKLFLHISVYAYAIFLGQGKSLDLLRYFILCNMVTLLQSFCENRTSYNPGTSAFDVHSTWCEIRVRTH